MEKRLKNYLKQMEEMRIEGMSPEERRIRAQALLIQIGFFQHERLIHLIVTVTFAILEVIVIGLCVTAFSLGLGLLALAILVFGAYGVGYDSSQFIYNQF